MDWDKLKIFHAVAEAGSFTNATINLNLSQSAISRQIQSLEQELKVQLFERHARGLTLTENGEYAVTIDSTHQCMTMRGIKKEQATTVTNYYLGQFKEDLSYQNRYLRLISNSKD